MPAPAALRVRGSSSPRVALALGSGGARGYAHIGVIQALRERGYDIVGIAGSSMGAVVGGVHAAGRLDEFAHWAKSLTQRTILRLLDPSISAAGILRAEKDSRRGARHRRPGRHRAAADPYTAVATDLLAGKSVWFQRGPLDAAIRASIAIPGVIAPHEVDGRLLADGGILDPLPMAPIAGVNADLTIAVSLNGSEAGPARDAEPNVTAEWLNRMVRSTSALFDVSAARSLLDRPTARAVLSRFGAAAAESDSWSQAPEIEQRPAGPPADREEAADTPGLPKMGSFEVMNRTIDIAQSALARHTLAGYPADLLIEVPRSTCRSLEFHRAVEVIAVGRALATQALEAFEIDDDESAAATIEG